MFVAHEMVGPEGIFTQMGETTGHSTGTALITIGTSEYGANQVPAYMRSRRRTYVKGFVPQWDRRFTDPTFGQVKVKKMTKRAQRAMLKDAEKRIAFAPFARA